MENWQLTLVILASVLVGALIPMLLIITAAFYRVGKEIAEIGARLTRTLAKVETISDRVEMLSRGFKGGETDIASLLSSVGELSRGLERNMKIINIFSAIMASVGPVIAAFVNTRLQPDEKEKPLTPEVVVPGNGSHPTSAAVAPDEALETF